MKTNDNAKKELRGIRLAFEDCPTCGGSGQFAGIRCGDCQGIGIVTVATASEIRKISKI